MTEKTKNADIIKAWLEGTPVQYFWPAHNDWHDYPPYGTEAFDRNTYAVGDPTLTWRIKPDQLLPYFDADRNLD
jgi:hypothetical protein